MHNSGSMDGHIIVCFHPGKTGRRLGRPARYFLKDETLTVTYTEELGLQYIVSFVIWSRQAVAISSPEQEILPLALHNQREKEFRRFYMIIAGILTLALLADLRYSAWGIKRRQTKTRQKNRTRREEQKQRRAQLMAEQSDSAAGDTKVHAKPDPNASKKK